MKIRQFILECKQCLAATIFVVVLTVLTVTSWWFVLVGTNPFHSVMAPQLYDANGLQQASFKRGDWVYVKRYLCSDRSILANQSNLLYNLSQHASLSLDFASAVVQEGCSVRGWMFRVPPSLPTGTYEFRTTARFQNNLIGRDQATAYPPVVLTIE